MSRRRQEIQPPSPRRRVIKWSLLTLLMLLLLVVVVPTICLLLRPGRELLLRRGVDLAAGAVPGEISVTRGEWPSPGELHLTGILWTTEQDTLLRIDSLTVVMEVTPLFEKRIELKRVDLLGLQVDLPLLQETFPAESATVGEDEAGAPFTLAAVDSLLGKIPRITLGEFNLTGRELVLTPGQTLTDLVAGLSAELDPDRESRVHLHTLRAADGAGRWLLERGDLHLDLAELLLAGVIQARGGGIHGGLRFNGSVDDSLRIRISPISLATADSVCSVDSLHLSGGITISPDLGHLRWSQLELAGDPLTLSSSGNLTLPDRIEMSGDLQLAEIGSLSELAPDQLTGLEAQMDASFQIAGSLSNPQLNFNLQARAGDPRFTLPILRADLVERRGERILTLVAPEGVMVGETRIDTVQVMISMPGDTLPAFPIAVTAGVGGELFGLNLSLELRRNGPLLELDCNTLGVRVLEEDLGNRNPFRIRLNSATRIAEVQGLDLTGQLGHLLMAGRVTPDSLDLEADLGLTPAPEFLGRLLPEETAEWLEDLAVSIDASVTAQGAMTAPDLDLKGSLGLREISGERSLELAVEGILISGDDPGLRGLLNIGDGVGTLLTGQLTLPGRLAPEPPGWIVPPEEVANLELRGDTLDLGRLDPFLPPLLEIEGRCHLAVTAEGTLDSLELSGGIQADRVRVLWDRRSWISTNTTLELGGSTLRPGISGRIETISGVVHLPPPPRILLPDKGSAMLWTAERENASAEPDPITESTAMAEQAPPLPDLDLHIIVPGEIWLRGQGLEMELGGELQVIRSTAQPPQAPPRISGEFGLLGGHYEFLGRRFEVERGSVTLFGEEVPDPALDIILASRLGETEVKIKVTGTVTHPTLLLESTPPRSEGEILALLMSGGASDEEGVEGASETRLQDAAAGLLGALGAAALTGSVVRRTGLDQLQYREGSDGEAGSMLMGKYLSPRLMLQYEQGFDAETAFTVHLRYLMSRHWKVESSYTQGGNSGMELHWSRDD